MEIILRASEGKWLTDGENYGKTISLANNSKIDIYYEITEEEYDKKMKELEGKINEYPTR